MKKRILILALTLAMLFSILPLGASAELARFDFELSEEGEVYFSFNTYGHEFVSVDSMGSDDEVGYTLSRDGEKLTVTLTDEYLKSLDGMTDEKGLRINMAYSEPKISEFGGELNIENGKADMGLVWVEDNALGGLYQVFVGEELVDPSLYEERNGWVYFTDEFLFDESGAQRYEDGTAMSYTFRKDAYTLVVHITPALLEEYFEEPTEIPEQSPQTGTPSPILLMTALCITAVLCALCVSQTKKNMR